MAFAKRMQFARPLEGGQELMPGIPDHIPMQFIVSKINWETCDALQRVSRGWRYQIRSGHVYDARVLSKSTEAFLVLQNDDHGDINSYVLTLYSCKDGSSLPLPSIPFPRRASKYDGICLHGVVYVWVSTGSDHPSWVENFLCVLDLAGGDKKWTVLERKKYPFAFYCYGVLEGQIFRHGGRSPAFRHVFGDVYDGRPSDDNDKVAAIRWWEPLTQPLTEFYNPLSDDWSRMTPEQVPHKLPLSSKGLESREDSIACAFKWAREQQGSAIDDPRCAATAAQVY